MLVHFYSILPFIIYNIHIHFDVSIENSIIYIFLLYFIVFDEPHCTNVL